MNRRKLLSFLPLSIFGFSVGAKLKPKDSIHLRPFSKEDFFEYDISEQLAGITKKVNAAFSPLSELVETVCQARYLPSGKRAWNPSKLGKSSENAQAPKFRIPPEIARGAVEAMDRAQSAFDAELERQWESARECGTRFRYLRGYSIRCPRCGSWEVQSESAFGIEV